MSICDSARKSICAVAVIVTMAIGATQAGTSPRHRVGAVCNDGTESQAIGSGACSHHQGVKCWKYSDGSCTKP